MNTQIQKMASADAINLAPKNGKNCLLFLNTLNGHLGMISETGAVFHFDIVTGTFIAGE